MTGHDLASLRIEIDAIDEEIIRLLARRFQLTEQIGLLKARQHLAPVDPEREAQQASRYDALARLHGLDSLLVQRVFRLLIDEVVGRHRALRPDDSSR